MTPCCESALTKVVNVFYIYSLVFCSRLVLEKHKIGLGKSLNLVAQKKWPPWIGSTSSVILHYQLLAVKTMRDLRIALSRFIPNFDPIH